MNEVINFPVAKVDMDNLLLTVHGKGDKERNVPFSFERRKILFRYGQVKNWHGIVSPLPRHCPSRTGTKWAQRNSLRGLYLLQKRLGLPKFGWNQLRHTFATECVRAGGDVVRCRTFLGHPSLALSFRPPRRCCGETFTGPLLSC